MIYSTNVPGKCDNYGHEGFGSVGVFYIGAEIGTISQFVGGLFPVEHYKVTTKYQILDKREVIFCNLCLKKHRRMVIRNIILGALFGIPLVLLCWYGIWFGLNYKAAWFNQFRWILVFAVVPALWFTVVLLYTYVPIIVSVLRDRVISEDEIDEWAIKNEKRRNPMESFTFTYFSRKNYSRLK